MEFQKKSYNSTPLPLLQLAECFAKFPGIGGKTAKRLAYQLLEMELLDVENFANALLNVKKNVRECQNCRTFTDDNLCPICYASENGLREATKICVVESSRDIYAFEKTREFNGVYHVLHGLISPLEGIGPDTLRIKRLLERVRELSEFDIEIIMATNPTVAGDATALFISNLLKPVGVRVSRLAFGVPVGGILENTDEVTLFQALENRKLM